MKQLLRLADLVNTRFLAVLSEITVRSVVYKSQLATFLSGFRSRIGKGLITKILILNLRSHFLFKYYLDFVLPPDFIFNINKGNAR